MSFGIFNPYEVKIIFFKWIQFIISYPYSSLRILNFLPLDELWLDKGFQRGIFPVFVSVCVCTHLCLSTHPWKQGKIGLLNTSFDLCLPIFPMLQWLAFWLTRKILYSWIFDKWLSRATDAVSFTGMLSSPVQEEVPS